MKRALLALHDEPFRRSVQFSLEGAYTYQVCPDQATLLAACTPPPNTIIMDLNFIQGGQDIRPAREVYQRVKESVQSGKTKFYGLSARPEVVQRARQEGIPAFEKVGFATHLDELVSDTTS